MSTIGTRKEEHIAIVRAGLAEAGVSNGFDEYRFSHCALPDLDLDDINLSTHFLGHTLRLPFLISSMTGGPQVAETVNLALAEAAQALGIAFAVGSQRIALQDGPAAGLSAHVRRLAPDIPIYANLGAVQFNHDFGVDAARRAIDMIEADALILHLNPLQEAVQDGGDIRWKGLTSRLEALARAIEIPLIAKEVGSGLSATVSRTLIDLGISALDVAGAGGTSWAAVEGARSHDRSTRLMGEIFRDWGIPTAVALAQTSSALPDTPLIASGGIRHGLDAGKAIRLGATLVGQAARALGPAISGPEAVIAHFETLSRALRIVCFCTGSADLAQLRRAALL